jgi:two-component system, NtrC family, response regulator AtoC
MIRVLIVDDDPQMGALLRDRLSRRGFEAQIETSPEAALEQLSQRDFDAVVTDVRMQGLSGIELCERVTSSHPNTAVLVITAFGSVDTAIGAIRAGAHDFLPKPFDVEELVFRLERALQHRRLTDEVRRLREANTAERPVAGLLGDSPPMRKLREVVARIAGADASVLILGETGSGKEVVARAIHDLSERRAGPFVAINCAALPAPLLESELFGHARGAFTDAHVAREGLLAQASGGTLVLDEIGDLPLALQPKLLRALQERRVRPLGAAQERAFDARIIAVTNADLESAVEEGRFREDLLFRLDVLRVEVPPLRARGNDVLLLAQAFARRAAARADKPVTGLTRAAAEQLLAYPWPGNVRELENSIERAVALTQHEQILIDDLPDRIRDHHGWRAPDDLAELVPLHEVERRYIARVLEAVGGNKTLAARVLGVDRKTLYRKLERE